MVVISFSESIATIAALPALERDSIRVTEGTAELLTRPPEASLYIVLVDAAAVAVVASRVVMWAAAGDPPPGLLAVIHGGGGHEREALLAAGFDDVMPMPVSARELSARVRALTRRVRRSTASTGRLRFGSVTLDFDGHAVWSNGNVIALTSIEFAVLRELMKARGRPLSRADLLDLAWGGGDVDVSDRAVDNVIMRLRRKLSPELIETVRSVGFRVNPAAS